LSACPRCGGGVAAGQEYCLECGLRLPGRGRLGPPPLEPRRLAIPLVATAVLAVAGAALAIGLTQDAAPAQIVVTATGGSVTVTTAAPAKSKLTVWPSGTNGWTNVLVSVPKLEGRGAAVARAEQARQRGLKQVGVLDSSRYASLHPGYWLVFAGIYATEAEAASARQRARTVQRGARTQRIAS
jgi:hypothetical protein